MSGQYPNELLYTKDHEWARIEGPIATVGVTRFAVDQLGDVTQVDLPKEGETVKQGEIFGSVESVKAVSDLFAPLSGKVVKVNSPLVDAPEYVNEEPYDEGWMMPPIAWLAPRAILDAAGPWREDLTLNDDGEYFCRVLLRSAGIVFCPTARACYRSGLPGSLSRRHDAVALQSLARSIEANTAALLAHENSPRVRRSAANAWFRLAHDIFPLLPLETIHAELQAKSLGGSRLRVAGGRLVRLTERLFGWRAAARVKHHG